MGFLDNVVDGFQSGLMGKGPNYVKRQRAAQQRALQERLQGRWASKYTVRSGAIELLIDPDGNPTQAYPHVHVIHDEVNGEVRLVASIAPKRWSTGRRCPARLAGTKSTPPSSGH